MLNTRRLANIASELLAWGHRFNARLERMEGLAVVLYFWALVFSLCGGAVLLILGLKLVNSWVFLLGLMSLRAFAYLCQAGERYLMPP